TETSTATSAPASAPAASTSAPAAEVREAPSSVQPETPSFRRTIHVPAGEGLSEIDVALGVVEDFLKERPWVPWVIVAFLLGYLLGQRR
ncbi:MAG: SRPBCC family protein, partial [Chloroflexus sp.]